MAAVSGAYVSSDDYHLHRVSVGVAERRHLAAFLAKLRQLAATLVRARGSLDVHHAGDGMGATKDRFRRPFHAVRGLLVTSRMSTGEPRDRDHPWAGVVQAVLSSLAALQAERRSHQAPVVGAFPRDQIDHALLGMEEARGRASTVPLVAVLRELRTLPAVADLLAHVGRSRRSVLGAVLRRPARSACGAERGLPRAPVVRARLRHQVYHSR